ncbi:MAG: DHH family phosphoesterase, partial [Chloroflexota bacterium]|nr:DHH family phosphoesterase [Chloroflexota bacterium]
MKNIWFELKEIIAPKPLHDAIGGHPLVARTLARRGLSDPEAGRAFLDPAHYSPTPPSELPGLIQAADCVENAIRRGDTILVWGDFDVDGQTSTTLLVEALGELGAQVEYHIPVRAAEGHGIKLSVLQQLLIPNSTSPQLILTCDTGIAAHEAVDYAKSRGLTVVITDHHDLPAELPNADAITNSKLLAQPQPRSQSSSLPHAQIPQPKHSHTQHSHPQHSHPQHSHPQHPHAQHPHPKLPHPQPLSQRERGVNPLSTLPGVGVAYKLVEELYRRFGNSDKRLN